MIEMVSLIVGGAAIIMLVLLLLIASYVRAILGHVRRACKKESLLGRGDKPKHVSHDQHLDRSVRGLEQKTEQINLDDYKSELNKKSQIEKDWGLQDKLGQST